MITEIIFLFITLSLNVIFPTGTCMNNGIRFCGSKWKSSMYYQPAKYVRIEYKNQISLFDLQYENL